MDASRLLPRQDRYDYHPLPERADWDWPEGRRLAFCVTTNIEAYAFGSGLGPDPARQDGVQTQRNFAWRDYGNRVGIWRLFELADELGLPLAHNVNSLIYQVAPQIMTVIRKRGDEFVGHGRSNAESIRGMWEADEAELIAQASAAFVTHEGRMPAGWMGPGGIESARTLDLLKEAGYRYVMDWPLDDQPVWLRTRSGPILCVPYPIELNDIGTNVLRHESAETFADMIVCQFEEMVRQCERAPLVMNVSLHPFIVGQPFRLWRLRQALQHCRTHALRERVWWTRPGEIATFCESLPAGTLAGSQSATADRS